MGDRSNGFVGAQPHPVQEEQQRNNNGDDRIKERDCAAACRREGRQDHCAKQSKKERVKETNKTHRS